MPMVYLTLAADAVPPYPFFRGCRFVYYVVLVLQALACVALIAAVMSQTTKSEGLSGTIGGRPSATFRFKPGFEEQLATITKWCAVAFLALSFFAAVLSPH